MIVFIIHISHYIISLKIEGKVLRVGIYNIIHYLKATRGNKYMTYVYDFLSKIQILYIHF